MGEKPCNSTIDRQDGIQGKFGMGMYHARAQKPKDKNLNPEVMKTVLMNPVRLADQIRGIIENNKNPID